MTIKEHFVMDGLNIASTIHSHPKYRTSTNRGGYRATAAEIAEVLNTDKRFEEEMPWVLIDAQWVGCVLRELAKGYPRRRAALVARVDSRGWHLTDAACHALNA